MLMLLFRGQAMLFISSDEWGISIFFAEDMSDRWHGEEDTGREEMASFRLHVPSRLADHGALYRPRSMSPYSGRFPSFCCLYRDERAT